MKDKKVIAAHQPNFLPWLGLFYKIYKCDKFIWADDVQFSTANGINTHRNCIKTSQGKLDIRVPVHKNSTSKINEVTIDYRQDWIKKMKKTLYLCYGKARHYEEVSSWFEEVLDYRYELLADLNKKIILDTCEKMGINVEHDACSNYEITGKKEEYVVNLVRFFGGDIYYSGTGAGYLHYEAFEKQGMELVFSDYPPIVYPQLWGEFIENLSVIDYLFNCGFNNPF